LDSQSFTQTYQEAQWITNILVIITFIAIYRKVSKQVKQLMFFGLIVAIGGEVLFSLVLGMYTYRLENLPLYVPFGHAIIYASIYYLVKEPLIQKYQNQIIKILYILMIIYSTTWLILGDDMFGFICMLIILWLFKRRPHTKLFFLLMFFTIVYLELLGTYYQCWYWPNIWFDQFSWISSANPPSGISVFYFAFDAGCLWFYKRFNPLKWQRFKRLKALKKFNNS
jgi:hypothetical protein